MKGVDEMNQPIEMPHIDADFDFFNKKGKSAFSPQEI